jgi:hypothetical protein
VDLSTCGAASAKIENENPIGFTEKETLSLLTKRFGRIVEEKTQEPTRQMHSILIISGLRTT